MKEKKATTTNRLLGWREGEEEERSVKKKWILTRKEGGNRWSSQTPWCVRAEETAVQLRVLWKQSTGAQFPASEREAHNDVPLQLRDSDCSISPLRATIHIQSTHSHMHIN